MDSSAAPDRDVEVVWQAVLAKTQVRASGDHVTLPVVAYSKLLGYVLREHPYLDEGRVRAALLELREREWIDVDDDFGHESEIARLRD